MQRQFPSYDSEGKNMINKPNPEISIDQSEELENSIIVSEE